MANILCKKCGGRMLVLDSRMRKKFFYRRRVCEKCGDAIATVEIGYEEYRQLQKGNALTESLKKVLST